MRKLSWIALLVVAAAGSARAQAASIDPGMSREQVIARLGKPISEHKSGEATYLYYSNGDEKKYGMHDFVALEHGKVVDAVFRSNTRKFTGRSSSPAPIPPEAAIAKGHGGHAPTRPAPAEKRPPERKPLPPAEKKPAPPIKKEMPATKTAPAEKKPTPPVKKEMPAGKTAPAPQKAVPPAAKPHEPVKGAATKKIAPPAKSSDTAKKGTPAPTKKP